MTAVLGQRAEDDQRTQLAVNIAVLELLANRTGCFASTLEALDVDAFDELGNAIERVLLIPVAAENLDPVGDRRVWLLARQRVHERLARPKVLAVLRHGGAMNLGCSRECGSVSDDRDGRRQEATEDVGAVIDGKLHAPHK